MGAGIKGGVVGTWNKPKEFAHLIRNNFGSADNIPTSLGGRREGGGREGRAAGGLRPTTTTQDIKGKFKFCEAFKFVKHFLFFQTGLKVGMLEETGARQPILTTRAQPPCLGMPGGLLGQEGGVCLVSTGRALGREGGVRVRAVLLVRVWVGGRGRSHGGGRGVWGGREGGRGITVSLDLRA